MFGYDVNRHKVLGTSTGTSSFEFVFAPTYFSNTKREFKKNDRNHVHLLHKQKN